MGTSISLSITQNSQSIVDNTSNVTVKATIKWDYGSWNATGECYGSIKIDGTNYSFSGIKFNTGQSTSGSQVVMTKTVNVKHSSDGSKTLSCSTSFYTGLKDGTLTASASKALTTIPRKSTLSASNGTLGTAQTLTVTRQSSSFTHTITYSCGSASGTIATKSSSTSISFTPPLSLASQNTTGTSVSIKFTITTYNGSTSLGSNTKTITCSIPSSVKPSCSISVSDAAGYSVYVKGYSKFKITVKPTLAYGSEIASYSVKANGATYTTASVTTSVLASSGALTITATVKDKRGRTATATETVTVYDKSTLSASNGTLGTEQTLAVQAQSIRFAHTITYSCGSASGTIITKTSNPVIPFTPPLSLASQNTTGTSVSVKLTLTTYCDDKSIGTNTKTITCSMPSSVKPSVSIAVSDTTGFSDKYNAWVKGLSKLKVDLSTTTSYGSAIASYNTTVSGKKYTTSSFEVGLITSMNEIPIKATVTDKRGRTATSEIGLDGFLDYSAPTISKLSVSRSNQDGTANGEGEYVKVTYSAAVTPLNNINTLSYKLQYKKTSEPSYTTGETVTSGYSITNRTFIFKADTVSSYNVLLTVQDAHRTTTKAIIASTAFTIMHFHKDGRGMAIGKLSEDAYKDLFDVGLKLFARQAIYLPNEMSLYGQKTDGEFRRLIYLSSGNNVFIGHGSHYYSDGNTYLCGRKIEHRIKTGADNTKEVTYKPYYEAGDSFSISIRTAGYLTNSFTEVDFTIPLSKPVVGRPAVSVATGDVVILRQHTGYTHGSAANKNAQPTSYEVGITGSNAVIVKMFLSDTTNAVNNAPIGIHFNGTVTFE